MRLGQDWINLVRSSAVRGQSGGRRKCWRVEPWLVVKASRKRGPRAATDAERSLERESWVEFAEFVEFVEFVEPPTVVAEKELGTEADEGESSGVMYSASAFEDA